MINGHRQNLLSIFQAALTAVNGRACVRTRLQQRPLAGKIYMVAVGKAACAMAQGAQDVLGDQIVDALIITKHGHAETLPWPILEAGHPLVNEASLVAGKQLLEFVAMIPSQATVIVLISGGASALVEALPAQISLDQFQEINRWILGSGLDINRYNRIRRRLSRIKGGRLAKLLYPRRVLCMVVSDVPDNDLRAIGSGPLVADEDLRRPLSLRGLPPFITEAMRHMPPAPAPDDVCFQNVTREIVATLDNAKIAAVDAAKKLGYVSLLESAFVLGDAMEAGASLANKLLRSLPGTIHVWGGETTVTLPEKPGRGGRNQSLALAAAMLLQERSDLYFLAAGTDGTDGPTDDAGALVDGGTIARGKVAGLDVRRSLERADAGSFLEASGDLLQTGPTGTNVMDLMLGLHASAEA